MRVTSAGVCSFWPTPTAADKGYSPDLLIGAGTIRCLSPATLATGSGGQFPISQAARQWTVLWLAMREAGFAPSTTTADCRSSLPVRVSFTHGPAYLTAALISNPRFYELNMGWPIGWTAPGEPVTGFAAWLQRSRGELSRLITCMADSQP